MKSSRRRNSWPRTSSGSQCRSGNARQRMPAADRVLGLLGMAARAGAVISGTDRVREAARGEGVRLVLLARDASANSREKLVPLLTARGISHVIRYDRNELGAAIGRGRLSAVGVMDRALADRLQVLLRDSAPQV